MTPALDGAVELLERSLAYTGAALGGVDESPAGLDAPTPCARWRLRDLLAHMDDALDAFTEAAAGLVLVRDRPAPASYDAPVAAVAAPYGGPVAPLRAKACALLAAWLDAPAGRVDVGDARLQAPLLVATAALEITVHGWDVTRSTGAHLPVPPDLAAGLHGVARVVLRPADRRGRFDDPLPTPARAGPEELLLAYLGRVAAPGDGHPGSFPPAASHSTRTGS